MKPAPSLVFACGGSGGHIFPAVAVAEELADRVPGVSVTFVSSGRQIENEIFRSVAGRRVVTLADDAAKRGGPIWHPRFLLRLMHETGSASDFLKKERPDAVVGFGGHGSVAIVAAARMRGIPTLVHEQNVVPGLANRLLSPWADGTALSFNETKLGGRNVRITGNPIRRAIERDCRSEALRFFGFSDERTTLLVLGGSQGAESVNTLFFDAVPHLPPALKDSIQALHLCGKMKAEESESRLAAAGIPAKAFSFFDRMDLAYAAADLAIGRAGATFLAEMEARRLPSILVPYPYAGGHQLLNAEVVARRANAVVARQKDLDGPKLAALLAERFEALKQNTDVRGPLGPDPARKRLADFILEILRRR